MARSIQIVAGIALLGVLVVTAGCVGILPGEETSPGEGTPVPGANTTESPVDREQGEADGSGSRPGNGRLRMLEIDYHTNGSNITVDADIHFRITGTEGTMENVVVCVYDRSGTVLYETTTTLALPEDQKEVTVPLPETPVYLVVDHPAFRNYSIRRGFVEFEQGTDGTPRRNDQFRLSWLPFEYPRHDETGRCM